MPETPFDYFFLHFFYTVLDVGTYILFFPYLKPYNNQFVFSFLFSLSVFFFSQVLFVGNILLPVNIFVFQDSCYY